MPLPGIISVLWANRLAILIGILILSVVSYVAILKIQLSSSQAAQATQATKIEGLSVAKEMLENEKTARVKQDKTLATIRDNTVDIHNLVIDVPDDVRRSLKNEKLELLNNCIAQYNNTGVLPPMCKSLQAKLHPPKTGSVK